MLHKKNNNKRTNTYGGMEHDETKDLKIEVALERENGSGGCSSVERT